MNILIVGSNKVWAFENHYIKHLKTLGIKVDAFPAHDIFYDYYYKNNFNKILFRSGISNIYQRINKQLIDKVSQNKYDIVWIFKGMEIFPETIVRIKETGSKVVNFNPDHPFEYTFRGSGNKNVLKSIGKYDLHLCYSIPVMERIKTEYNIPAVWLPFGYEESIIHLPSPNSEINRVCFIGNPDDHRTALIKKLASSNIPIDLYGNNWNKWIKPNKKYDLKYHEAIYKDDFNKTASRYRVQLNFFRPQNEDSHNMRTFEMPGLGCIMLAPESKEHQLLFNENQETFFYKDFNDMLFKIKTILNLSYDEALQIRKNAINRCTTSGYTYKDRAAQVLKHFEELLKN